MEAYIISIREGFQGKLNTCKLPGAKLVDCGSASQEDQITTSMGIFNIEPDFHNIMDRKGASVDYSHPDRFPAPGEGIRNHCQVRKDRDF